MTDFVNDLSIYRACRHSMKTGDLLQWKGNHAFSRIIRVGTREDVNHTSMIIRLWDYPERVFSIEARADGLHLWPLSSLLKKHDGFVNWYPIEPDYESIEGKGPAVDAAKWLLAHLGVGYDFVDCASNWRMILGFNPNPADAKFLYCSESVFLCFKERYLDAESGIVIGAGLDHLQGMKISPVPGRPMLELGMWGVHRSVQIIQESLRIGMKKVADLGSGSLDPAMA